METVRMAMRAGSSGRFENQTQAEKKNHAYKRQHRNLVWQIAGASRDETGQPAGNIEIRLAQGLIANAGSQYGDHGGARDGQETH